MQTVINDQPEEFKAGEFCFTGGVNQTYTYATEEEVKPGYFVQRGSSDTTCERLKTGDTSKQIGVACNNDELIPIDADTTLEGAFPANQEIAVANFTAGIAVYVDDDVTPDDDVYARIVTTRAVQTIAFDIDFEASNSIAWTVNGVAGTAVVYATSHAATIAALATAIAATQPIYSCSASGRTLTITSENADQPTLTFTVTGGTNQAVDAAPTVTVAGVEGDLGVCRADSDSGKAVLISNAKFLSSGSSGDLVTLQLK